jgi:DNA-binding transcriptional ArsR family regulator
VSDPVDAVFSALADGTRRRLLARIAEDGPVTATQLASELPISRQAVAKHLGVLGHAGLVAPTREGRETRYRATPEPLDEAQRWMDAVGRRWDDRLAALRRRLEG